jgi:hypothetical protein
LGGHEEYCEYTKTDDKADDSGAVPGVC